MRIVHECINRVVGRDGGKRSNCVVAFVCEEGKNGIVSALLALQAAPLQGWWGRSAAAGIGTSSVEYMTGLSSGCAGICPALVVAVGDPP